MTAIEARGPADGIDARGRRLERGTSVAETPQAAIVREFSTAFAMKQADAVEVGLLTMNEHRGCGQSAVSSETCRASGVGSLV